MRIFRDMEEAKEHDLEPSLTIKSSVSVSPSLEEIFIESNVSQSLSTSANKRSKDCLES